MKRNHLLCTAVVSAFVVSLGAAPAAAKGGSGNAKKPTVRVATAKPAAATKAATPKVKATGATKAKTSGAPKVSSKPSASAGKKTASKPTVSSTRPNDAKPTLSSNQPNDAKPTVSSNPAPTVPLNKAQQLLMKNDNLRMKMQARLGGSDPILAASEFRNLGQFVAAVNASYNNPDIPFRALKALMTGEPPMSLGQAKKQILGTATTTTSPTTPLDSSPTVTPTAKKTKGRS